ncbi:MAG: molybdate ABC transporter substrate-binding protein, partial [Oscillospiraceae bacterium]|nr:molybdate ABC transporter substrate-binding protein [Oscillospiraceae bacterium]
VKMLGLGESSVPVGQYARDIFTNLGMWDKVKAKANFGSNVRQVLSWVETGSVDCGVVYSTDAKTTDKVKVVAEAPKGSVKDVVYPAAVVASSKHQAEAKAFLDFLSGDTAAAFFKNAGFTIYTK